MTQGRTDHNPVLELERAQRDGLEQSHENRVEILSANWEGRKGE